MDPLERKPMPHDKEFNKVANRALFRLTRMHTTVCNNHTITEHTGMVQRTAEADFSPHTNSQGTDYTLEETPDTARRRQRGKTKRERPSGLA